MNLYKLTINGKRIKNEYGYNWIDDTQLKDACMQTSLTSQSAKALREIAGAELGFDNTLQLKLDGNVFTITKENVYELQ